MGENGQAWGNTVLVCGGVLRVLRSWCKRAGGHEEGDGARRKRSKGAEE